ncbi:MAG: aldose 1-epimerase [Solirubrobacterales bacterium]|nr:aldose 1-epimerase [Solirubrobacterales bacterium]
MVGSRMIDGFTALTLSSPGDGDLEASFVPDAGMVGCSLRHRGEELLGLRGGLKRYVSERSTMGIPLLHPWANVVSQRRFSVAGAEVDLDRAVPPPHEDENGLPIHGLLSGITGWEVLRHESSAAGALLAARFDFGENPALMAAFPFAHIVEFEAKLKGPTLTITTTVTPTGDRAIPISFGYHPYFRLPGIPRSEWEVEIPVTERVVVDSRMLPTGATEATEVVSGRLGDRTFDDLYPAPPSNAPLVLAGGGRRIELAMDSGYPFAQVYAPAVDDVVALEPMTAPINALVSGSDLQIVQPGEDYAAAFSIGVSG